MFNVYILVLARCWVSIYATLCIDVSVGHQVRCDVLGTHVFTGVSLGLDSKRHNPVFVRSSCKPLNAECDARTIIRVHQLGEVTAEGAATVNCLVVAALRPTVAFAMVHLSRIRNGCTVLDPFAGGGECMPASGRPMPCISAISSGV